MNESKEKWKIDKHIPLALIIMLIFQTSGALWWASKVDSSVSNNTLDIKDIKNTQKENRSFYERIVRVEVLLERIIDELKAN